MIDMHHKEISIRRQCDLLNINRSTLYYNSVGDGCVNEKLMQLIDRQYTATPFYGVRRMVAYLVREGYHVNHKRVSRLMRRLGINAIYPKARSHKAASDHLKFPYLIRSHMVNHPDHAWATDITYIRLKKGFIYLTAIMDWYSRYVLSWEFSNTLDADFCVAALRKALLKSRPEIFNSDQGSQFTSKEFISCLQSEGIQISMCGKGRVYDNIFIERLWRTLKYEEVYLNEYKTVTEAKQHIANYLAFYNNRRPHQSLGYQTPREVYETGNKGESSKNTNSFEGSGLRPPPSNNFHLIQR